MAQKEGVSSHVSEYYPYMCLVVFAAFWIVLAIHPYNTRDWALENILVAVVMVILLASFGKMRLSNFSYTVLTIFLILHSVGAHYTYSRVPMFDFLGDFIGLERNSYDRVLHFLFGLVFYFPLKEWVEKMTGLRGFWATFIPVALAQFLEGLYEIMEFAVAQMVNPSLGLAFVGAQGDIWDSQKDMAIGFIGALSGWIALLIAQEIQKWRNGLANRSPK